MNRRLYAILATIGLFFVTVPSVMAETPLPVPPFHKGVNLNVWFEVPSAHQIQFTRYTKKDFENIKSLGADVIRLPINLHFMTSGAPSYILDPLFLEFLDSAVNWAEELGLYIILDNHTFDPVVPTDPKIGKALLKVWPQMAEHFRNRSKYVLYEVLNEPHGIDLVKWGKIQGEVVDAIRAVDTKHTIVVGAGNYNNYRDLGSLPAYKDSNLLYTFHFYDPFVFTHQGANWCSPSLENLSGVPFPPDSGPLPSVPKDLQGSWVENTIMNYSRDGTSSEVKKLLDIPIAFAKKRNVAIFCGEYGVYIPNSKNEDRVRWYQIVREYLEANGVAWTSWGYLDSFGLTKHAQGGCFETDLNLPLLRAMGFNIPVQLKKVTGPEKTGFDIYRDFTGPQINWGGYIQNGVSDFYSTDKPASGKYAIHWGKCRQYNSVGFDFLGERDLTRLVGEGYVLEMMVRTTSKDTKLDIRFLNPGALPADLPWRSSCYIDEKNVPADGVWHKVRIPLADMFETGAWKGKWFDPAGKFDWSRVIRFEIVSEFQSLEDKEFWFDDILITK